jgi:uncharacterized SAM-binding protein YcdF (DUF218 family)
MSVNRILQIIGGIAVASFLLVAFTPLVTVIGSRVTVTENLTQADAIVVLGGGQYADGELGRASLRRAVTGLEVFKQGYAPRILMLGPDQREGYRSEAVVRRQLAETMGIDPDAIMTEEGGQNTRGEAQVAWDRLEPLGITTILLVTETQHLIRAKPLFENVGFEVFPVPANHYSMLPDRPEERIELMMRIVQEQMARIYYRAAGYL